MIASSPRRGYTFPIRGLLYAGKTTYIDLVNPEDDAEETVGIILGWLKEEKE